MNGRRAGYFTAPRETRGLPIGQRMPVHTERPAEGDIVSLPALGGLGSLRRECLDHSAPRRRGREAIMAD